MQPVCSFKQVFQYTYLLGTFSPLIGYQFLLELPSFNADNFQLFLNQFSEQTPDEYKIMLLDNGAFHKAKSLVMPDNIFHLFLSPYSPELKPAKKYGSILKDNLLTKLIKL